MWGRKSVSTRNGKQFRTTDGILTQIEANGAGVDDLRFIERDSARQLAPHAEHLPRTTARFRPRPGRQKLNEIAAEDQEGPGVAD